MNNINEMQYINLQQQKNRLEARKKDLINWKFMGGGLGLFIFLFILMFLGVIVWIIAAIANNNEIKNINFELDLINSQINQFKTNSITDENTSIIAN